MRQRMFSLMGSFTITRNFEFKTDPLESCMQIFSLMWSFTVMRDFQLKTDPLDSCMQIFSLMWSFTIMRNFEFKTVWPSGLRRWLKAPFRKGVGSNPTAVIYQPKCTDMVVLILRRVTYCVCKATPPAGLEPAIFGLEVRRLVH